MDRDTLKPKQVRKETGWSREYVQFLRSIPELWGLVQEAIDNDWFDSPVGQKKFKNRFESSRWFKENASSARGYLMAEAQGGADFEQNRETVRDVIRARATQLGARLSDEALDAFTTAYFMNGWGEEGRAGFLDQALTGQLPEFDTNYLDYDAGGPDAIITQLRGNARANGLDYSDGYFEKAAQMVLGGTMTLADYIAQQRDDAATVAPLYADRIRAGENLEDIASPYIGRMARALELDPNDIDVNDKWIKQALGGVDDKGNPVAMPLWEFEKALKQDERWQFTKNAHDEVGNIASRIVSMFTGVSQ